MQIDKSLLNKRRTRKGILKKETRGNTEKNLLKMSKKVEPESNIALEKKRQKGSKLVTGLV